MTDSPKITIGITTYNRKAMLERMARSLHESDLSRATCHIRVYDDCSSEYGYDFLKKLFPDAVSITINETNKRSDQNIFSMYKDFLATGDEYFFNADSDLIFNKEWLNFILDNFDKTDGILSVFNTVNHKEKKKDADPLFIQKVDIGSAGTFFSRERMEQIVSSVQETDSLHLDWDYSARFTSMGIRILCSKDSYVQHIGLAGQNSVSSMADFGEGFVVDSITNGQILNDVLLEITKERYEENMAFFSRKLKEILDDRNKSVSASFDYKLGHFLLTPCRILKRLVKK